MTYLEDSHPDVLKLNNEGLRLVRRVVLAREAEERAKREIRHLGYEVSNAESELLKWFLPKDYKIGETYCMPVGDAFLEIRITEQKSFSSSDTGGTRPCITPKPVISWRNNRPPKEKI